MSAYFVTSTGTDIGKTYVTAGIIRAARACGRPGLHAAGAIKPIMSGYSPLAAAASDAGVLLDAMGKPVTAANIAAIAPWRFSAPLSPDMAAAREGRTIDLAAVTMFCRAAIAAAPGLMLIEGAGGLMAPLTREETILDWLNMLNLPVILIAGSYLGTISHTLTTARVLLAAGRHIAAIVLSESPEAPVSVEETALTIGRFLPWLRVEIIPRDYNDRSFANLAAFF